MTALTRLLELDAVPPDARLHGRVRRGGGADRRLHRLARQRAADQQGGRDAGGRGARACASSSRPAARARSPPSSPQRSAEPGSSLYLLVDAGGRKVAGNLTACRRSWRGRPAAASSAIVRGGRGGRRASSACAVGVPLPVPGGLMLIVGRDIEDQRRFAGTMGQLALWSFGLLSRARHRRRPARQPQRAAPHRGHHRDQPHDHGGRSLQAHPARRLRRRARPAVAEPQRHARPHRGADGARCARCPTTSPTTSRRRSTACATAPRRRCATPTALPPTATGSCKTIEEADELIKTFNSLLLIARLEGGRGRREHGAGRSGLDHRRRRRALRAGGRGGGPAPR